MFTIFFSSTISLLLGILLGWLITIITRRRLKHTVHLFQNLIMQSPVGFFYVDINNNKPLVVSHTLALQFNLKSPIKWEHLLKAFSKENAAKLHSAYQTLCQKGIAFSLLLPITDKTRTFMIKGSVVYSAREKGFLVTFQDVSELAQQLQLSTLTENHKNILANALDAFNFPLFIRDKKGMSFFANQAVNNEKTDTLNDLNWLSIPFKSDENFYTLTYGQETKTEEELQHILSNTIMAQRRLCNYLPCAVCLFNATGQLLACSAAFANLWHLDKKWVQSEPSYEDYWDTIQDNGLLSRVADFASYKKQQREDFACLSTPTELFLYLPDEKIIRRTLIPYVQGSVILLDEIQTN